MLFVAHATLMAERSKEAFKELKKLKPSAGIVVKGMYAVFGKHDILMIFDAESEKVALDFVLELRNLSGILDTETSLAADIKHMGEGK